MLNSSKKTRWYSLAPHLLILLGIGFLLLLPETPPKITSFSKNIAANEPFSLTYSKALQPTNLENHVRILKDGQAVLGTFKNNSHTLIFTPQEPWQSDSQYELQIDSLASEDGITKTAPLTTTFAIQKELLLFLDRDGRLTQGDPKTGETKILTPPDIEVQEFSLAPGGRLVGLYIPKENSYTNGIFFGEFKDSAYNIEVLPAIETPRYTNLLLCNNGDSLLMVSATTTSDRSLQYFNLDWKSSLEKRVLQGWAIKESSIFEKIDIACSEKTQRFVYRKPSGAFVSSFLGESTEDLIGVYDQVIGFTPKDTTLVLQKITTPKDLASGYVSELSFYQSTGTKLALTGENTLFENLSFGASENLFSLLRVNGENFQSQVDLYEMMADRLEKKNSVLPPENKRFVRQVLSLDTSLVALESAPDENIRIPNEENTILLWNTQSNQISPIQFTGKAPQWMK
jgi:Bacterial Ig-like domain